MSLAELNLAPAMVEIFIFSMASLILLIDLLLPPSRRSVIYFLALATLAIAIAIGLFQYSTESTLILNNMYIDDGLSDLIRTGICISVLVMLIYSRDYIDQRGLYKGEYFVLTLYAVVGMMLMASAHSFLSLYLGLELLSLCLYTLVAFQRDDYRSSEAAMKYFILGALGSGMLLYGMSLLYGLTGSLEIGVVRNALGPESVNNAAVIMALIFVLSSMAFKMGAVPFHMWVPDVYHGSPTSTTTLISTAPKLAGFAIIMRLLVGGLEDLHSVWIDMIIIIAILSIAIGNLIAIAQTNFKRMLAYSAISHIGFMFLGVLVGNSIGYSAALFYILVYALMSLGGFGMIMLLSRNGFEAEELSDLKGLNKTHPWYAFLLLLLMFSMAGIPPTIGFVAKLSVIQAVIQSGHVWLAVVVVLLAVIGAFYYLRVIKLMYFDDSDDVSRVVESRPELRWVLSINALAVIVLMPWVGALQDICSAAISSMTRLL